MKCQFKLLRMAVALICSKCGRGGLGKGSWVSGLGDVEMAQSLPFKGLVVQKKRVR